MSGSHGTRCRVRGDPRAALPGRTGLVPGTAGPCKACCRRRTTCRHRRRAEQGLRLALQGRAGAEGSAAGPCRVRTPCCRAVWDPQTALQGHARLAPRSVVRCRTGEQRYGAVQGLHPVLQGRAGPAGSAAGPCKARQWCCRAVQHSHPALQGRVALPPAAAGPGGAAGSTAGLCRSQLGLQDVRSTKQRLRMELQGTAAPAPSAAGLRRTAQDPHPAPRRACGGAADPRETRPMLRGRVGPSPGAKLEPTATAQTPGLEGATSCLPPAHSHGALQSISAWCHPRLPPHTDTGAQEPLLAPCGGSRGGAGAPPHLPPPLSVLAPLRAPRGTHGCPLATSAARCELASTPHRAAGGPPAAAGGVPGDGRPGPRPPRTGPPGAFHSYRKRRRRGRRPLRASPRLSTSPCAPPAEPLSLRTPDPAPEPGLGTHPHPEPDPAAMPQHLQLPDK